jgi:hypothetical protein
MSYSMTGENWKYHELSTQEIERYQLKEGKSNLPNERKKKKMALGLNTEDNEKLKERV